MGDWTKKIANDSLEIVKMNKIALPYLEVRQWVKSSCDANWKKQWKSLASNLTKFRPKPEATAYAI